MQTKALKTVAMWAGPGFPWEQAQGVVAEEASSLVPGDWVRRQQHLCHRKMGQWPSALGLLTSVTGQVHLEMDTPLSHPNPMWHYVPSGCSWHDWHQPKMETTPWCISEALSNPSRSLQMAEYSGAWQRQEVQRFRAQAWEPGSLGRNLGSAGHCRVVLGWYLTAPCLSFSIYKMGMMRLLEPPNGSSSPHD